MATHTNPYLGLASLGATLDVLSVRVYGK